MNHTNFGGLTASEAKRQLESGHLTSEALVSACLARIAERDAAVGAWTNVDPERARKESPFGGPIAHGFLTLSLIPALMVDAMRFEQKMGVNYGLNRVRFLKPVPVGTRVRALFAVKETSEAAQGGVQVTWSVSVQAERPDAPLLVCAAEFITLHYF